MSINIYMKPVDILYTPLDIPEPPKVDLDALVAWICKYQEEQEVKKRQDFSKELKGSYPWNIIYCKQDYHWYKDFDKEFPALAEYCHTVFDVPHTMISDIVVLHTRNDFVGEGFWHSDPDPVGLRFFLECQETGEFLRMRPSKLPYFDRTAILSETENKLQSTVLSARLLKPNQGFYLNNVRAMHAVYTAEPGKMRVTFLINVDDMAIWRLPESIRKLIVDSAEKYSDYALLWKPPESK